MKQKLLIVIPLLLLLFKACKPDEKCVDGNNYRYIDEYDYGKIPYKDHSQLTFVDKKTKDTLVFTGQGFQYGFGKYVSQGECPQTTNLEYRSLTFINNKNADKITIINQFIGLTTSEISFNYKINSKSLSPAYFNAPFAYDSLLISGKYYYNIKDFTAINSTVDLCFLYTLKEGIVQLIYPPTNDTLNLIKLEL
jgi:hypothetical protein